MSGKKTKKQIIQQQQQQQLLPHACKTTLAEIKDTLSENQ